MVCLDFLKRNLRKLLLTRVYNGRLLKPSLCLLSDVHYHAADVLFWVFLRTADATRSQLSSECCVVDVYRFCEAYWWSLAVWHDRDGEHWCRVICVAICWIDWRLFADRTGAFKLFWGVNWHRLSSDLLRVIRLSPVLKLSRNAPERHTGSFWKGGTPYGNFWRRPRRKARLAFRRGVPPLAWHRALDHILQIAGLSFIIIMTAD